MIIINILFLADLHEVDYYEWQKFLNIDNNIFDIIILLGDIDIMFLKSIKNRFINKKILGVHGNHDYVGDLEYSGIENIHGKSVKYNDLIISGVEGCLDYKKGNDLLHTDDDIFQIVKTFNINTNIIISHNSPLGIHDKEDLAHKGYSALKSYIERHNPKYLIHGHQHTNNVTKYKNTTVIGIYGGAILNIETGSISHIL